MSDILLNNIGSIMLIFFPILIAICIIYVSCLCKDVDECAQETDDCHIQYCLRMIRLHIMRMLYTIL